MDVLIFAVEYTHKKEPLHVRQYSFTLDNDFEPTVESMREIFKHGVKTYHKMRGRVFVGKFANAAFMIDPNTKPDYLIYRLW